MAKVILIQAGEAGSPLRDLLTAVVIECDLQTGEGFCYRVRFFIGDRGSPEWPQNFALGTHPAAQAGKPKPQNAFAAKSFLRKASAKEAGPKLGHGECKPDTKNS